MTLVKTQEFSCPVCKQLVGPWSRGITLHAKIHGLSTEEFWLMVNHSERPTCKCSPKCSVLVSFKNWSEGFCEYAKGHSDVTKKARRTREQLAKHHWSRGKTSSEDSRIRQSANKIAKTLTEGFASGRITHWSKGLTKLDHPGLMKIAVANTSQARNSLSCAQINERLASICADRFHVSSIHIHDRNARLEFIRISCTRCSGETEISLYNLLRKEKQRCTNCDVFSSTFEESVGLFVDSLVENKKRYSLNGKEVDIFVPKHKFAIECNGLYWHSDAVQKDRNFHQLKSEHSREQGVSLLHIFEDEWRDKSDIIKSMIAHKLGRSGRKLFARKCDLVEVPRVERRNFFQKNHIDGDVKASASFGLKFDGELIACMSIRKPFSKIHKQHEVARFACALDTNVVGALGRLTSRALREAPNGLISYVDTRLGGDGTSYIAAGWRRAGLTGNRFWWTDTHDRFDRTTNMASSDASERENAQKRRLFKIWGCKNVILTVER